MRPNTSRPHAPKVTKALKCSHARTSLVRAWDGGHPFALEQCDLCGAVGPAPEADREMDVFGLPEMDVQPLKAYGRALDAEIRRLEALLRPNNPQLKLALAGALIEGGVA